MAINRDVEVRCRISILCTEVMDENDPTGRGGGRRKGGEKRIVDVPLVIMDNNELVQRATDIADIILHGYELEGTQPVEAVTEHASAVTTTTATLNARILPNVNTTCGFLYGTTKELDNTVDAVESPVAGLTDDVVQVTGLLTLLTPNTRYYYRAWAQLAGLRVRYGRIKSFVTLAV
jgi:hypothetical protein